jgi:glycolate oxidase iron-sulfur subunit
LRRDPRFTRVAWQAPCTLQHGQGIDGTVERLLQKAGYQLLPVADAHLCCGSAGSYAALQPELSQALRARKLDALLALEPDVIATANVGCQMHLGAATGVPVVHWLELVAGINEG